MPGVLDSLFAAWQRSQPVFWAQTFGFLSLTLRAVGVALIVGIPAGILLSRFSKISSPVIAFLGLVQTLPSLALVGLMIPLLGIGQNAALLVSVVYSLFPIVLNTYVGITQVPEAIRDAARGMGMTSRQMLGSVELPLALPVILAGVRTGAVYAVGTVTICALVGAGGLGDFIVTGLTRGDDGLVWLGALPILVLTLLILLGLSGVEALARRSSRVGLATGFGLIVVLALYAAAAPALRPARADIRIGGKNFTEGYILTDVLRQMIEAHTRLRVEVVPNLGETLAFKALQSGDIDIYPEYSGNLLTNRDAVNLPIPDDKSTITGLVREQMKRRLNMDFMQLFGLNNTYALLVPRKLAEQYKLETIDDLARVPQFRVIVDLEFLDRPDGWKGLVEKYGLRFNSAPKQVSPDLIYRALEAGEAELICGFSTDWQIDAFDLAVLKDSRGYFPTYHAAPLARGDLLARHPEIVPILDRLKDQIDDVTMRRLNREVARDKQTSASVAERFLRERGLKP